MEYRADRYYDYSELKELLTDWAKEYADICAMESIGKTYLGKDIYAFTLTIGGKAEEKPGILIDGGLHSMEMIGSNCALYALHHFLSNAKSDPEVEKTLTEKTIYVIPRINCDGMDEDYYGRGQYRGSVKPFHPEEDGITTEDIDGNGEILKMRIEAEDGDWKACKEEPRLMVRRTPADTKEDGPFYYLYDEGYLRGPLTEHPKQARMGADLDPNRQWPFSYNRHAIGITMRECAGPYPMYDCEIRALADFVAAHNNITVDVNEHSYMGAYISPMEFFKNMNSPVDDSMIIESIGKAAHEETGYMYDHIFPLGLNDAAPGSFTPWLYFDRGIAAWCNETWHIRHIYDRIDAAHPVKTMDSFMSPEEINQEYVKLLKWGDENGEEFAVPWHTFDHPQLGEVEIGGLRTYKVLWNPPTRFLEDEEKRALLFINRCIASAPQMAIEGVEVTEEHGQKNYRVTLSNKGLFPSFGTRQALNEKNTTLGKIRILKDGKEILSEELPEIYGGMQIPITLTEKLTSSDEDAKENCPEKKIAGNLPEYTIEVITERAGTVRYQI